MDFAGQNIAASDAQALTGRFRYELAATGAFAMMEREQMYLILQGQAFQQSGCVDQGCAVEALSLIHI